MRPKIIYRLLHKKCNILLGRELKKVAELKRRALKKRLSVEHYALYKVFSTDFTYKIRKFRSLNQSQIDQLIFRDK